MLLIGLLGFHANPSVSPEKVDANVAQVSHSRVRPMSSKANVLWLEDFEGGFPGSMTSYIIGDQTSPGWQEYTSSSGWSGFGAGPMGQISAGHNDDDVGTSCDDWLVSPAITIPNTGNPVYLTFYHGTNYAPSWTDYHGIWISTGSGNPNDGDFVEFVNMSNEVSEDTWTKLQYDLSAYAGQTIYIAFRYQGDYADEWYLDSIMVWEDVNLNNDLAIRYLEPLGGFGVGTSVAPQARVVNLGLNDAAGVNVVFEIYDGAYTLVYADTQVVSNLISGDSIDLTFADFSLTSVGPYIGLVYHTWADDEDNSNDTAAGLFGAVRYAYTVYATNNSPTIDGVLDDPVWQEVSDTLDVSDFMGTADGILDPLGSAMLLAAHNFDTLFVAMMVPVDDAQDQYDQVSIVFDDNNDDMWPASDTTEGANGIIPTGWYYLYFTQSGGGSWTAVPSAPPFAMNYGGGYMVAEFAVPIVHDPAQDVGPWTLYSTVAQGVSDTVGALVYYVDSGATLPSYWPQDADDWVNPALYADLVLAGEMGAEEGTRASAPALKVLGFAKPALLLNLPASAHVSAAVYDVSGRQVKLLVQGKLEAGIHKLSLSGLKPGVYAVRVQVNGKALSAKFVIK